MEVQEWSLPRVSKSLAILSQHFLRFASKNGVSASWVVVFAVDRYEKIWVYQQLMMDFLVVLVDQDLSLYTS